MAKEKDELRSTLFFANKKVWEKYKTGLPAYRFVSMLIEYAREISERYGFIYSAHPEGFNDYTFYETFVLDCGEQLPMVKTKAEQDKGDVKYDFYKAVFQLRIKAFEKYPDELFDGKPLRIPIIFFEGNYTGFDFYLLERGQNEIPIFFGATIMYDKWNPNIDPETPFMPPFIVINLNVPPGSHTFRRTIVHEMIHACGHDHPDPGGGDVDGEKNDIMNYNSIDKLPYETVIRASHVDLLKRAYFGGELTS